MEFLASKLLILSLIPLILFIGITPTLSFSEETTDATDNFIGTDVICSLTDEPPYYDCSKKWYIHLYDTEFPKTCNQNIAFGLAAKACTKYTKFGSDVISAEIHLGTEHGSDTSFPYPDGPETQSVLYHELQHAICGCNWHPEIAHDFIN